MRSPARSIAASSYLVVAIFTIVLIVVSAAGCTETASQRDDGHIVVTVTIPPEMEFVERVGGDHVQVILLVPPGADPHTYELPPGILADVAEADAYAMVGSGMEFELAWKDRITALNPDMLVINCSNGIELISDDEGRHTRTDPHVWLSPRNAKTMVENICQGLIDIDPTNAADYRRNTDLYQEDLDVLDREIEEAISKSGVNKIMVYHSSWAYFARDYDIEEISIESEGKEPSPRRIENLVDQAKEEQISMIFASPEHSTRSAEVIADEIGGTVVLVSPLEQDYLTNMREVASAFAGSGSR